MQPYWLTHGFLGNDASFMLDVVVCASAVAMLGLFTSLWLVRQRNAYQLHKWLQIILAIVLLITVVAFEVDLQFIHGGWIHVVNKDPDAPRLTGDQFILARSILWVHLVFAVTTPFVWATTIALALRKFPVPAHPNRHSRWHIRLGWISAIDLVITSMTGWAFYYVAFVM